MVTKRILTICTIVSHALIIVGIGHAIGFFFLLEIFAYSAIATENFSFAFDQENHFPVIGFMTLLGQIVLVFSLFTKKKPIKSISQIAGHTLLWLSIFYFAYDTTNDNYLHLLSISCLPFAICTLITFVGHPIKRFYEWIIDKETIRES